MIGFGRRTTGRRPRYQPVLGGGSLPIVSNLGLWLRSDKGITLATGVSAWNDQSGNGNNSTQATGSQQPTYITSDGAANGKPTLSWSGAASQVLVGNYTGSPAQPYTIIVVGQTSASAQQATFTTATGALQMLGNAGVWAYYDGTVVSSAVASTSLSVVAGVFNGASSALYVNNSQTAAANGNPGSTVMGTNYYVGAALSSGASNPLTGKIAEIIVYTVGLTTAQLKVIFQYLGARYKIATS